MQGVEIYIKGSYIPRDEKMCVNVLIKSERKETSRLLELKEKGSAIEAEYIGLIKILKSLKERLSKKKLTFLKIFTINEVIVKQVEGRYKVNKPRVGFLFSELMKLLDGLNYQVIWLSKSEMNERMKPHSEIYSDKQLKDLLSKIDFDGEDIWV